MTLTRDFFELSKVLKWSSIIIMETHMHTFQV